MAAIEELLWQNGSNWLNKGLFIYNLNLADGRQSEAPKRATKALLVGIALATVVNYFVILIFLPSAPFAQVGEIPLYGIASAANAILTVFLVTFFLFVFRARIETSISASLTAFAMSGAIPLLTFFAREQLIEAMRLFVKYRDPSLPYLDAATYNVLFPDQAALFATARAWLFVTLEVAVFVYYYCVRLGTLLTHSSHATWACLRVAAALVTAVGVQALLVHLYFGEWYWGIIGSMLRDSR